MAAETSWHRYGKKLRHCHHMYVLLCMLYTAWKSGFSPRATQRYSAATPWEHLRDETRLKMCGTVKKNRPSLNSRTHKPAQLPVRTLTTLHCPHSPALRRWISLQHTVGYDRSKKVSLWKTSRIRPSVLIEHRLVTDRRRQRQTQTPAQSRVGKIPSRRLSRSRPRAFERCTQSCRWKNVCV